MYIKDYPFVSSIIGEIKKIMFLVKIKDICLNQLEVTLIYANQDDLFKENSILYDVINDCGLI